MKRRMLLWLPLGLAAAPFLLAAPPARAVGDQTGELLGGGRAKGDISKEPGETDRVGVDLMAGEPINVTFTAGFHASFVCTDPDGVPVDFGVTDVPVKVKRFVTPKTGRFEFVISSSDGTQGAWKLVVRPAWAEEVAVAGAGDGDLAVPMPAGGKVWAKIRSVSTPSLAGMNGPDQASVLGPIPGTGELLKVPKTLAVLGGTYVLAMDVVDDVSPWSGKVFRRLPRYAPVKLNLTNGLTPISFEGDGVDRIFATRCGSCHDWARGYVGVRATASDSLARIRTGNMPAGSPRLPNDQIALITAWIQTGMNR